MLGLWVWGRMGGGLSQWGLCESFHASWGCSEAVDAPQACVSSVFISTVAQRLYISPTLAFRQVDFEKKSIFGIRAAHPHALTLKPAAAAAAIPKAVVLQAQLQHSLCMGTQLILAPQNVQRG